MKLKTIFTVNVLIIMTMLLAGCAKAAPTQEAAVATEAPAAAEPVTLTIIIEQVPDYEIVAELAKKFEAANPGIKIVWDAMPYDAMRDKILTSFMAPEGTYDIIIVDNPWMDEFPAAGFLTELNKYIEATPNYDWEDFIAPIRELTTHDGVITAVPYLNYAVGLIVRQDLFDDQTMKDKFKAKYNRDLAAPKTLDEYLDVGVFFKENGIAGAAMQPQKGYKINEEEKNYMYAEGGDWMDKDGKPTANTPAGKRALEMYIKMFEQTAPANSINWGFDDALRSMASGESATMISYNWMLPSLNKKDGQAGDLAGKFQLYPVPGGKAVLGAWYWGIPKNSKHPDEAWKFLAWLTSPEIDKERTAMGGGVIRTSTTNDSTVWEKGFGEYFYKTVNTILSNSEPLGRGVHADEISVEVGNFLNAAVVGEMTVEEALAAIDAKIAEINAK
jgi:multiple sugar transport system substrate-binding protein